MPMSWAARAGPFQLVTRQGYVARYRATCQRCSGIIRCRFGMDLPGSDWPTFRTGHRYDSGDLGRAGPYFWLGSVIVGRQPANALACFVGVTHRHRPTVPPWRTRYRAGFSPSAFLRFELAARAPLGPNPGRDGYR